MGKVNLEINGKKLALGCPDGEEERLTFLGQKLDDRIKVLANQFGQLGDFRLMVIAGITMTDELEELQENLESQAEALSSEIRKKGEKALAEAQKSESTAADALADAARRIERLAERLNED
jgi:cell division protein ZapA